MGKNKQKRILLVEDDIVISMVEQKELELYGYWVKTVHTGEKALIEMQKGDDFDLILMDINLGPGLDGTEVAQQILATHDIPIVFLSSHTEKTIVEKTEKITSYGYVVKNSGITILDASIKMAFKLFDAKQKTETQKLHLSTTLNSIGDAVIATDMAGSIILMNPVAESLTGWKVSDAERKAFTEIFKIVETGTCENIENPIEQVLKNSKRPGLSNGAILISTDGKEYHIVYSGSPIQNDEGKISGVVMVFRDITEENRMRIQKNIAELQSKNLFEMAGDGVAIRDLKGNIIETNRNLQDLFGYSKEEFRRTRAMDLIADDEESKKAVAWANNKLLNDGYVRFESNVVNKAGQIIKGEITNKMIEFDGKKLIQTIFRNITQRKLDEQAIQEERDRMQMYLDIAGVMFVALDGSGLVNLINRKGQEVLGYTEDDIIGKNWFDHFLPGKENKSVKKVFKQVMSGAIEMAEYFENSVLTKSGEERIIAWHNTVLKDDKGNPIGTLSSGNDITERKKAEEALNRSEILFRAIAEQSGEGIGLADEDGNYVIVNPAYCLMSGYDESEMLTLNISDLVPPKTEMKLFPTVLNHNQSGRRELELIRKDGSRFLAEISGYPVELENKRLVLGIIRDVTEHYRSKEALIESEMKFRSITENATDLIFIKDISRKYTFVNQAMMNVFKLSEKEIIGKSPKELFGIKQAKTINDLDDRAFSGQTVNETQNLTINNESRFFNSIQTPLHRENGKVKSIMGIVRDVTDQIQTQYQLETIYKTSAYMISIVDTESATFIKVNPAFTEVLGYSEQELLERPFTELIHPDDLDSTHKMLKTGKKKGDNVYKYQNRFRTRNGDYRWLDWSCHLDVNEGTTYAIARDITESKQSEKKINSLLKEKELLLQEVHHRIKNNMIVVKSLLSLQASNVKEESAKAALETAESRMTSMMILYDKIYRSEQKDEICINDYLSSLVDEIINTYPVRVEVYKKMTNIVVPVQIASPLGIIVNELLSNSMKYAFLKRDNNRLDIMLTNEKGLITLTVQDNGKGFDAEKSPKGFGLELVRNLSRQIEGRFRIEQNGGSKCILEFGI